MTTGLTLGVITWASMLAFHASIQLREKVYGYSLSHHRLYSHRSNIYVSIWNIRRVLQQ